MAYYGALRKRNSLPPNDEQAANEAALKQLLEEQRAAEEEEERRRRLEEEKAAYAEKLRRLFEAYGGDADAALAQASAQSAAQSGAAPADPAAILFTSGSTGPPKGVLYTHGMFCAQVAALRSRTQDNTSAGRQPGGEEQP